MVRNDDFIDMKVYFNFHKKELWHENQRHEKAVAEEDMRHKRTIGEIEAKFEELEERFNAGVPENHPLHQGG